MASQDSADKVIRAAVVSTVCMGGVPIIIDVGALVAANATMLIMVAAQYNMNWDVNKASSFVFKLIGAQGLTIGSMKALATFFNLTGVGLPVGCTINAMINGVVTLALGRSCKKFCETGGSAPDDLLLTIFARTLSWSGLGDVIQLLLDWN